MNFLIVYWSMLMMLLHIDKIKMDSLKPPHKAKVIGIPSYDRLNIYTVAFQDGSITEYSDTNNILEACQISSSISPCSILPTWIQEDA